MKYMKTPYYLFKQYKYFLASINRNFQLRFDTKFYKILNKLMTTFDHSTLGVVSKSEM